MQAVFPIVCCEENLKTLKHIYENENNWIEHEKIKNTTLGKESFEKLKEIGMIYMDTNQNEKRLWKLTTLGYNFIILAKSAERMPSLIDAFNQNIKK